MAAYRDRDVATTVCLAFLLYLAAIGGLVGMIVWKLWTAFAALPL